MAGLRARGAGHNWGRRLLIASHKLGFSFFYLLLRDLSTICEEERNSLKFLSV